MRIPSEYNIGLLVFGIIMIASGIHILILKDSFGKDENLKTVADILHLSEKGRKVLNAAGGIIIILGGIFALTNAILYINGIYWIYFPA